MAVLPYSVVTSLNSKAYGVKWTFEHKTRYSGSNTWLPFEVEPGWKIKGKANDAAVFTYSPINGSLSYADESDQTNRAMLRNQVRVKLTINGVTETVFYGENNDNFPSDADFGSVLKKYIVPWETSTTSLIL